MTKGVKRRNFFDDKIIEDLHLKVKYGKLDNSDNPIEHDSRVYAVQDSSYKSRLKNRKNEGTSYAPPFIGNIKDSS